MAAGLVELDFQGVDTMVADDDLFDRRQVARGQAINGLDDLFLDQSAHVQHAGTHRFQFGVELFGDVFSHARPSSETVKLA